MARKNAKNTDGILKTPVEFKEGLPTKKFEKTSKYADALVNIKKKKSWFLIATFEKPQQANGIAQYLRKNPLSLPKGVWEFSTRTLDDGRSGLFAQIVK